ncbi:TPA: hypothetical protein EYP66_01735 [Candidatus Poribacteria bacterium]|nr:hypothetical protein [Candidatus Poribacteria bacterium]
MLCLLVDNNGAVFVMTLVMVSLLAILGATFASIVTFEMRNANWQLRRVQAFYLAEAALNKGIVLVRNDEDWSTGGDGSATHNFPGEGVWYYLYDGIVDANNVALGDGTYSIQLQNPLGSGGNAIDIKAVATIGEINRTIQIRMLLSTLPGSSVFAWAIFGSEGVKITGSANIDSYNSDNGLYEEQVPGENGNVGSNDDIRVVGSATIAGNATCGPDPDDELRITGSAHITGSTDPASELVDLPPLDIDFPFPPSGQLKKTGSGTYTLTDGIYCFTEVKFTGSYELLIEGDVTIYCESASFTGSTKITVNGTLTVYCTGDFKCTGGGIVNTNQKPEDFTLYCTGGDIKLTGNSEFHGAAYAPNGDATITGGNDYYGAIVAGGELKGTGSCEIHCDEALMDVVDVVSMEGEQQVITASWREGY